MFSVLKCHARVRIASDPEQPSLNLAQAVLILAYEIRLSHPGEPEAPAMERAAAGELEAALAELEEGLLGIGYLNATTRARSSPSCGSCSRARGRRRARRACCAAWRGRSAGPPAGLRGEPGRADNAAA